jgi:hypothetical protein
LLLKICTGAGKQGIEGDLAVKGVSLAVVNKTSNPIRNIHVWSSAFMVYASVMLNILPILFLYLNTVTVTTGTFEP